MTEPISSNVTPCTFHAWERLPTELQIEVLNQRLLMPVALDAQKYQSHTACLLFPLLLTRDAKMQALSREVFYGINTFIVDRRKTKRPLPTGPKAWSDHKFIFRWTYPNASVGKWVRNLEVHIRATSLYGVGFVVSPGMDIIANDWAYLLVEQFDCKGLARHTAWQGHFPAIDNLKIVVKFERFAIGDPDCLNGRLAEFVHAISSTRVSMQPKRIEVEVRGLKCRPGSVCGGRCVEVLEAAVAGRVVIRKAG